MKEAPNVTADAIELMPNTVVRVVVSAVFAAKRSKFLPGDTNERRSNH